MIVKIQNYNEMSSTQRYYNDIIDNFLCEKFNVFQNELIMLMNEHFIKNFDALTVINYLMNMTNKITFTLLNLIMKIKNSSADNELTSEDIIRKFLDGFALICGTEFEVITESNQPHPEIKRLSKPCS